MQRQYSGTAGRIENCRVGVFLGHASRHGQALVDRALYPPGRWTRGPARRAAAGIPDDATPTTEPQLGPAMLDRALAAGVPFARVAGDGVYGADHRIRRRSETRGEGAATHSRSPPGSGSASSPSRTGSPRSRPRAGGA